MTKTIKNLTFRIRALSQHSLGITIPADIVNGYKLVEGDLVQIPEMQVESNIAEYECGVCGLLQVFADYEDKECKGCGEKNHLIFKDSINTYKEVGK